MEEFGFEPRSSDSKTPSVCFLFSLCFIYLNEFFSERNLVITTINKKPILGKGKNNCNENQIMLVNST